MRNWKYRIQVSDLHEQYRDGELSAGKVALELSTRIKNEILGMPVLIRKCFRRVTKQLESVDNVDEYDNCLEQLYDLGDAYDCWIGHSKNRQEVIHGSKT